MKFHEHSGKSQAHTQSTLTSSKRLISLRKHIEDTGQVRRRQSDSIVPDANDYVVMVASHIHGNATVWVRVPRRIAQEVCEYLGQPRCIAIDVERDTGDIDSQSMSTRIDLRPCRFDRIGNGI